MGAQQEDVEKFLNTNPAFAQQYFAKKMDPASISKVSGLGKTDFCQFQELSQVSFLPPLHVCRGKKKNRLAVFIITCGLICIFWNQILNMRPFFFSKFEESQIMYDLIKDMQENINMEKVVFKILKRISALIHADRCSLFMYRQRNGIGELATRLFNINTQAEFDDCVVPPDSEIVYPLDLGIVGHVALTKKPVNVKDVAEVSRWKETERSCGVDAKEINRLYRCCTSASLMCRHQRAPQLANHSYSSARRRLFS